MIRVFNLEFFFVGNDFQCSRKINLVNIRYGYVNMDTQRRVSTRSYYQYFYKKNSGERKIFVESTRIYMKHNGFINCIASNRFSDLSRNKKKVRE